MEYSKLKVAQLRDLLKEKGLPTNGNKGALVKRLEENEVEEPEAAAEGVEVKEENNAAEEDADADYDAMKKSDLVEMLKERGLDHSGLKSELVERLKDADGGEEVEEKETEAKAEAEADADADADGAGADETNSTRKRRRADEEPAPGEEEATENGETNKKMKPDDQESESKVEEAGEEEKEAGEEGEKKTGEEGEKVEGQEEAALMDVDEEKTEAPLEWDETKLADTGARRGRISKWDTGRPAGWDWNRPVGTVTSDGVEYKMQNGQVVFDPTFRGFKLLAIGREVEFFPGKRSNGDLLALYVTGPEGKPLKKRAEEAKKIATIKPGPLRRVNRVPGRTNTRLVKPAAARRFGSLPFPPIPFPPPPPHLLRPGVAGRRVPLFRGRGVPRRGRARGWIPRSMFGRGRMSMRGRK
ncbi:hypothetical protein AAMO2058_001617000 [Amorphochlora amoebiformis]